MAAKIVLATGRIANPVTANFKLAAGRKTHCFKSNVSMIGLGPIMMTFHLPPSTFYILQSKVETDENGLPKIKIVLIP